MASQGYYNQGGGSGDQRYEGQARPGWQQSGYGYSQQNQQPGSPPYDNNQSNYASGGQYHQGYQGNYTQPSSYGASPSGYYQQGPPPRESYDNSYNSNQPPEQYHTHYNNSQTYPNQYGDNASTGYGQSQPGYSPQPGQDQNDRGFLGAVAGGVAGAYGGHKLHHGVLGGIGGAVAGSMIQDHFKDKKKEDKKHEQQQQQQQQQQYSSQSSSHQNFQGNFSASCEQITIDKDYDLIANCADVNHNKHLSSVSLNDCLTNEWGVLKWAKGGNFAASARNVRLVDGGKVLEAELNDGKGGWKQSSVHLDEKITNDNGDLRFLG